MEDLCNNNNQQNKGQQKVDHYKYPIFPSQVVDQTETDKCIQSHLFYNEESSNTVDSYFNNQKSNKGAEDCFGLIDYQNIAQVFDQGFFEDDNSTNNKNIATKSNNDCTAFQQNCYNQLASDIIQDQSQLLKQGKLHQLEKQQQQSQQQQQQQLQQLQYSSQKELASQVFFHYNQQQNEELSQQPYQNYEMQNNSLPQQYQLNNQLNGQFKSDNIQRGVEMSQFQTNQLPNLTYSDQYPHQYNQANENVVDISCFQLSQTYGKDENQSNHNSLQNNQNCQQNQQKSVQQSALSSNNNFQQNNINQYEEFSSSSQTSSPNNVLQKDKNMKFKLFDKKNSKLKNFFKNIMNPIIQTLNKIFTNKEQFIKELFGQRNLKQFLLLFPHLVEIEEIQNKELDSLTEQLSKKIRKNKKEQSPNKGFDEKNLSIKQKATLEEIRAQAQQIFGRKFYHMIRYFKKTDSFKNDQEFFYGCIFFAERQSQKEYFYNKEAYIPQNQLFKKETSDLEERISQRLNMNSQYPIQIEQQLPIYQQMNEPLNPYFFQNCQLNENQQYPIQQQFQYSQIFSNDQNSLFIN